MIDILLGLLTEVWKLLVEMAPYLLFGFLVAGVLHLFLSKEKVARHLAHNRLSSVVKASLFGVPLPLCSCGVIPVAAHLKKQGAGRGPVISFLISTPTTGVDSILATYSLLGPLLAIMRPLAALVGGVVTGLVANTELFQTQDVGLEREETGSAAASAIVALSFNQKIVEALRYAFIDLIEDVSKWLAIGILAGGVIAYFVPAEIIGTYLGNPWLAYSIMLLIGIPMYVCATGSIPIAASLILKGLSPGAGFIFLFAGPATNTATLSFVGGTMGKKMLALYLSAILLSGLCFGWLTDFIWQSFGQDIRLVGGQMQILPPWLSIVSAIILTALIVRPWIKKILTKTELTGEGMQITVPDMSCEHCKKALDRAIRDVDGVQDVVIDLESKKIEVVGEPAETEIAAAVTGAGFHIETAGD